MYPVGKAFPARCSRIKSHRHEPRIEFFWIYYIFIRTFLNDRRREGHPEVPIFYLAVYSRNDTRFCRMSKNGSIAKCTLTELTALLTSCYYFTVGKHFRDVSFIYIFVEPVFLIQTRECFSGLCYVDGVSCTYLSCFASI